MRDCLIAAVFTFPRCPHECFFISIAPRSFYSPARNFEGQDRTKLMKRIPKYHCHQIEICITVMMFEENSFLAAPVGSHQFFLLVYGQHSLHYFAMHGGC